VGCIHIACLKNFFTEDVREVVREAVREAVPREAVRAAVREASQAQTEYTILLCAGRL
jgi:hypothetical protein